MMLALFASALAIALPASLAGAVGGALAAWGYIRWREARALEQELAQRLERYS